LTTDPEENAMLTDQIVPNVTRVVHEDYGVGTVQQVDGKWLVVLFDGDPFASAGIHVEDVQPAPEN
jgi:hypothetical protein